MSVLVTVLAVLGSGLALAFVVVYSRGAWRESLAGRIVMGTMVALGVLFGLRVVVRVSGPLPEWVWAVGYTGLDLLLAWWLWLALWARHRL